MRARLLYIIAILGVSLSAVSQRFVEEKAQFRAQALAKLRGINTEPAKKIAFDFQNAWDAKFTSEQQGKIQQIALEMQNRGYSFYPSYYHFFAYLAYSVEQGNLQRDQLSKVLDINASVIQTLSRDQYEEFLFGLNIFFARKYLSLDKNISVQMGGGSFDFKLLGEQIALEEQQEEEQPEEDTTTLITAEEIAQAEAASNDTDTWGNNDSWDTGGDPWADNSNSSDDWGSSDDSWGNTDDSWGNTDDAWGNTDDSWGDSSWGNEPASEPAAPVAQEPDYAPIIHDYVKEVQFRYAHPKVEGPVIDLIATRLTIGTNFDSLTIKNVNADFTLQNRAVVGEQGTIEWPASHKRFRGATVQLKEFHLKKDRPDFWTPNATLQLDSLLGGAAVNGVFEYSSIPRPKRKANPYPIFTSYEANVSVKLSDKKVSYLGGVQLRGNKLLGKSISRQTGTLKILDGRGNTVVLRSPEFSLDDSLFSMDKGSFTIIHGSDSITHPSVRAKYNPNNRKLLVLRRDPLQAYKSTYYGVNMNVDLITWDMDSDSLALEIMNGKDLLPASFESIDFFNLIRYKKLGRYLDFHPINAAVMYSRKYGVEEFYAGEMAIEYKIDERFAEGAGKILSQYGFADYESSTGLIRLKKKAFLYFDASGQKVDYDNLMIPSRIQDGSNAHLNLDSGTLKIRGVHRFYFTTDFKVYAEPRDSTMTLLKNRNIEFDGMVHAGDFQYKGAGHQFDYQEFLFNMPQIDSIRLTVSLRDSSDASGGSEPTALKNELAETSGTLYINNPENRSGRVANRRFPYFNSDSQAVVYFDGKEVLNGAYDKSVRFIIPPFEVDSLEREDGGSIRFEGTFNSGGIFPTFAETLTIQDDKSLGFTHQIPQEGYNLYGTEAKTYEEIRLSNKGMRGYGQIDFLTTTIYSDDFIYYPDSVTTDGTGGVISPGNYKGASYPEAVLGAYDMYWLPRKDSMYLRTVDEPFKFYNSTAELEGEANITTKGVYGGGTMLTRGSKSISSELNFKEFEYSARHTQFEVLTDDPTKPAMKGDDIRLDFDLNTNTATIIPEKIGVAAISFPYAQMKTSITQAIWDLEDSVVTMTKPERVAIEDSYFFTTRQDLDSLAFNATKAVYDINTKELNIQGIPYIIVADSKIIPEGNETTILANSVLQEFENAEIIIDTLNGFHYLDRASIRIFSRNLFEGSAYYQQIVGKDTFDIRFDSFELQEVPIGQPDRRGRYETRRMTVSGGEVLEAQNLKISAGFLYKGGVTMFAYKPALELEGYVKMDLQDEAYNNWIQFKRTDEKKQVRLDFTQALLESGEAATAGLHFNIRDELYCTFVEKKENASDIDFFNAKGMLTFNDTTKSYRIETPSKTTGATYAGSTMVYVDSIQSILFEGLANFVSPSNEQIDLKSTVLGAGQKSTNEYNLDAMLRLKLPIPDPAIEIMAEDLSDIIQRIGPALANDISLNLLYKLANMAGEDAARKYEESSLKEYTPMVSVSRELEDQFLISGVKMKWNTELKAWHNTTKLAISNMLDLDLNAKLDGFLEIKKDESGTDVVNLFIQAAPGVWYYFGYSFNQLIAFSSNPAFNEFVKSKSNVENTKPGELILALGEQNETLSFINDFRLNYFGIKEPYNLVSPDDASLEDEKFDTIEEDDDDGFGF